MTNLLTELGDIPFQLSMMILVSGLGVFLGGFAVFQSVRHKFWDDNQYRRFKSAKKLSLKDYLLLEMLQVHTTTTSYCITDPDLPDNEIIFCSDGFSKMTGYKFDEVEGRNCRFLQGPMTRREDIEKISYSVKNKIACHVEITNYKKDGEAFRNSFYMCPLFDENSNVSYYIGIQGILGTEDLHYISSVMRSPLTKDRKKLH